LLSLTGPPSDPRAAAKETASQAGIAKVEFGTFDESFDAIAEPGWQEFDQKQSLD